MRKKIFSILMTLALVISLIPASTMTAFASTVQWESEPNDYIQHADEILVDTGYSVHGTKKNYSDLDYYKFTLEHGSIITANVTVGWNKPGEDYGYVDIELYEANNFEHAISDFETSYDKNYGYDKGEDIWYLPKGEYVLIVECNIMDDGEEYKIDFYTEEYEFFDEPNDYIEQATLITLNETYHGLISAYHWHVYGKTIHTYFESEKDMFKLDVPEKGNYYLNVKVHNDSILDAHILNSDGDELDLWTDNNSSYTDPRVADDEEPIEACLPLEKGVHYISIESKGNVKYSFNIVKQPAATSNISTSLYGYNDIAVNWNPVPEAEGYRVYYKKSTEEDFVHWGNTTEPSMQMAGCADDMGYCFKIVAYKTVNGVIYEGEEKTSDYIYTLKKVNKPTATKAGGASVTLSWTDISGESGYEIAKSASKDSGYTISKTVGANKENVTVKTAWNKPFYYKVRAFKTVDGTKIYGPWSTPVKRTRYLAVPARMKVKLSGDKTVSVSWSKVSGASGYNVYYKKASASKYTFLKRTTATSIKKTGLANGTKYKFKVVPYAKVGKKRYETTASKTVSAFILEKVNQPKVKKVSQNYITVSWNNIAGESGYQIAKSTFATKNFNIIETVGKSCSKAKISSKRNKTYYYKVRAYKYIDGNRVYGSWSEAKAFNLK